MNTTKPLIWKRADSTDRTKSGEMINCTGTSLLLALPSVSNEMVKAKFGKLPKGLTGKYSQSIEIINNLEEPSNAIGWTEGTGIYTLYTLYGEWRIGGFSENKYVKELSEFLFSYDLI